MNNPSAAPFESAYLEADVLAALRECFARLHPDVLAQLPQKCRPGPLRDSADIAGLSFTLTRALIASGDSNAALASLESLCAHAHNRLTEIKLDRLLGRPPLPKGLMSASAHT